MREKTNLAKIAVFLILTILLSCVPIHIFANSLDTDVYGIAVSDVHRDELENIFSSRDAALKYAESKHTVELLLGVQHSLSIVSSNNNEPNRITWQSSNSTIAEVDQNGVVSAVKEGSAIITATVDEKTISITVEVKPAFSLNHSMAKLSVNRLCNLDVQFSGDLSPYAYDIRWVTANESLALVGKGLVLASMPGDGEIIAYIHNADTGMQVGVSNCSITVLPDITSVAIVNKTSRVELGSTLNLSAKTVPEKQPVIWESSDTKIATIDQNGVLTSVGVGEVTISAYAGCWNDNQYTKIPEIVNSVKVEVWSDATTKYNIAVSEGDRGEIIVDKQNALAGEKITVTAVQSVEQNGNTTEVYGATALDVVDENGMAITVKNLGFGTFSFEMPKSEVSISAVYSTLYGVTYEPAIKANFVRNRNLIGNITIKEYFGGAFNGVFTFASENVMISDVEISHGKVASRSNGIVSVSVGNDRDKATDISIKVYADSQSIISGSHSLSISGDLDITMSNSFVACYAGTIASESLIVDYAMVENIGDGSAVNLTSAENIVIYGEALRHIIDKKASINLNFSCGTLSIPNVSLMNIDPSSGDFTVFSLSKDQDLFENNKSLGKFSLTIRTYTNTGSYKNQLNIIGKASLKLASDQGKDQMTLQTSLSTIETNGLGVFAFDSMSGLETFTVLTDTSVLSTGDIIFIIVVVVLLIALGIALYFVLLRAKKLMSAPPIQPDPSDDDETEKEDDDEENDEVAEFDEAAFRTVEQILRESNLSDQADSVRSQALDLLKSEIDRELDESPKAIQSIERYQEYMRLKSNVSSDVDESTDGELRDNYVALQSTHAIAEDLRKKGESILKNDKPFETDDINDTAISLQQASANLSVAAKEFEKSINEAMSVLNDIVSYEHYIERAKEILRSCIDDANRKEQLFDEFEVAKERLQEELKDAKTRYGDCALPEEFEDVICEWEIRETVEKKIVCLHQNVYEGTNILDNSRDYCDPQELLNKASEISDLLQEILATIPIKKFEDCTVMLIEWLEECETALVKQRVEQCDRDSDRVNGLIKEYENVKVRITNLTNQLSQANADVVKSKLDDLTEREKPVLGKYHLAKCDIHDAKSCEDYLDLLSESYKEISALRNEALCILQDAERLLRDERTKKLNDWRSDLDHCNKELTKLDRDMKAERASVCNSDERSKELLRVFDESYQTAKTELDSLNKQYDEACSNSSVDLNTPPLISLVTGLSSMFDTCKQAIDEYNNKYVYTPSEKVTEIANDERSKKQKITSFMASKSSDETSKHDLLISRFEECVKRVIEVHAENMRYIDSCNSNSEDNEYLKGCSFTLYNNTNEIVASNYWEMKDDMLNQLISAIDQDIDLVVYIRSIAMGSENLSASSPIVRSSRMPRKKLRFWQAQMESNNPYAILMALSKVESNRLRIRYNVIAHRTNNLG